MATLTRHNCPNVHGTVEVGKTYRWSWRNESERVTVKSVMEDRGKCKPVFVEGSKSGAFLTDLCCIREEVTSRPCTTDGAAPATFTVRLPRDRSGFVTAPVDTAGQPVTVSGPGYLTKAAAQRNAAREADWATRNGLGCRVVIGTGTASDLDGRQRPCYAVMFVHLPDRPCC